MNEEIFTPYPEELEEKYNNLAKEIEYYNKKIELYKSENSKKKNQIDELENRIERFIRARESNIAEMQELLGKMRENFYKEYEPIKGEKICLAGECVAICFGLSLFATDDDLVYRETMPDDEVGSITLFEEWEKRYCFETLSRDKREAIWQHIEGSPDTPSWFSRENWDEADLSQCSSAFYNYKNVFGLDELKKSKRDCDVDIEVTPAEDGDGVNFHFTVKDKNDLSFNLRNVSFNSFIDALYNLIEERIDCSDYVTSYRYDEISEYGRKVGFSWDTCDKLLRVEMIRRRAMMDYSLDYISRAYLDSVRIFLTGDNQEEKWITVKTEELCYATASVATELIKTYGAFGYQYCTGEAIDLNKIILIKAYALGVYNALVLVRETDGFTKTLFDAEMDMLFFDM